MLPINKYITIRNRNISNRQSIPYLAIHYVGAVSTAKNNCSYFYSEYRGASAHYFVDDSSIWQCVEDKDIAWHVGAKSYRHPYCRNTNSIGIEMCCYKRDDGSLDMSDATIQNTIELAAYICKKYNIPLENVVRHYDVTGKTCPAPFVNDPSRWDDFKNRLSIELGNGEITPENPENNTMEEKMHVIATDGLNVRTGAGVEYTKVDALPYLTNVTVYEMSNGWGRIGEGRWVCASYLEKGDAPENNITAKEKYVNVNTTLNIRVGAGTQYRIIGSLRNGNKVTVYDEKDGWSRIGDGQWVSSQYLSDNPQPVAKTMYVVNINTTLNIRSGAGTNYKVVGSLRNGQVVTVYEENGEWSRIGNGQWVNNFYLSTSAPQNTTYTKYVCANGGLRVRSGAGTNYKIVGGLLNGQKVTVYETKGNWSRIGNGQWVCNTYLK